MENYDAGLLNDYGGGNIEWWQDYIRTELSRSHEFYSTIIYQLEDTIDQNNNQILGLNNRVNELKTEIPVQCLKIIDNIQVSSNNYGNRVDYARLKMQEISDAIVMEFNL